MRSKDDLRDTEHLSASAVRRARSTHFGFTFYSQGVSFIIFLQGLERLLTGSVPGYAASNGETCVFGESSRLEVRDSARQIR